jgi:small conductance mechanosensitive channel
MLLLFRPFHIGDDVEVAGKAGKVRALSLFTTELAAPDDSQILLPNGSVWGSAIINRSSCPGTGDVKISFPIHAGQPAKAVSEQLRRELGADLRLNANEAPQAFVSKVVDVSDPKRPLVELTVTARTNPTEANAVRQGLLDRMNVLLSGNEERIAQTAAG